MLSRPEKLLQLVCLQYWIDQPVGVVAAAAVGGGADAVVVAVKAGIHRKMSSFGDC
jgi:tripartite-type tricarboxylate transporter receptor subunit TctC